MEVLMPIAREGSPEVSTLDIIKKLKLKSKTPSYPHSYLYTPTNTLTSILLHLRFHLTPPTPLLLIYLSPLSSFILLYYTIRNVVYLY